MLFFVYNQFTRLVDTVSMWIRLFTTFSVFYFKSRMRLKTHKTCTSHKLIKLGSLKNTIESLHWILCWNKIPITAAWGPMCSPLTRTDFRLNALRLWITILDSRPPLSMVPERDGTDRKSADFKKAKPCLLTTPKPHTPNFHVSRERIVMWRYCWI